MRSFTLLLLLLCSSVAMATDTVYDRINLQAQAEREVANDRMRVVMVVQGEDKDPARLAQAVNAGMHWALNRAKGVAGVDLQTGSYNTHPVYDKSTLSHWRATQTLVLESAEFPVLSELAGRLQERLTIQSMGFFVSDAARKGAEEELIDQALDAFKARAARVQRNLDAGGWRVVELNINTNGYRPRPPMALMEARMSKAPAVEGGSSDVSVTVSGTIQLLPAALTPP